MFTHKARQSAVIALLTGLVAAGPSSALAADAAPAGPLSTLAKAKEAADAESARAAATDAAAAPLLDGAPVAGKPADGSGAAAPVEADTAERLSAGPATAPAYDPSSHRDPFKPPTIASSGPENPRTPLERYEIGQLKLVGVVWDTGEPRAMVEDSAGLGYILTVKTPIGVSGGVVKSIEPRRVLIEEQTQNFYGEKVSREVVMELPQEDRSP